MIIWTHTSIIDMWMLNYIVTVTSTLQKLSCRIMNVIWQHRVIISVFCHDFNFLFAFIKGCLPWLWYCNVQCSTKACQFCIYFGSLSISRQQTVPSRGLCRFFFLFCFLTSRYCMLMSVSDTVTLRMWQRTSPPLRHVNNISKDSRRDFLRLQKRWRCITALKTETHVLTHKSSASTSQRTQSLSITKTIMLYKASIHSV
jgi:hypothetical protein